MLRLFWVLCTLEPTKKLAGYNCRFNSSNIFYLNFHFSHEKYEPKFVVIIFYFFYHSISILISSHQNGCDGKHCKNCECCPVSQLIVRSQRLSWIQVLNCQHCSQCLKCHKSLGLLLGGVLKMYLSLSLLIFLAMSCLLITLNKGHKSLGLLLGGVLKMSLSSYLSLSIC